MQMQGSPCLLKVPVSALAREQGQLPLEQVVPGWLSVRKARARVRARAMAMTKVQVQVQFLRPLSQVWAAPSHQEAGQGAWGWVPPRS